MSSTESLLLPSTQPFSSRIDCLFDAHHLLKEELLTAMGRARNRLKRYGFIQLPEDLAQTTVRALWDKCPSSEDEVPDISYQVAVRTLIALGLCHPNVAVDWEVDRDEDEVCNQLGIRSFKALQDAIAFQYDVPKGRMVHLHKGPGDGSLMRNLRPARPDAVRDEPIQVGIGCALPFSIEKVLNRFIRQNHGIDPSTFHEFFKILGFGLRRQLKKKWFEADGSQTMLWEKRNPEDICDINVVYEILKQPERRFFKLFQGRQKGTFRTPVSVDFEDDGSQDVSPQVTDLFKDYFDNPKSFLKRIFTDEFMRGVTADSSVLENLFKQKVTSPEAETEEPVDLNGLAGVYPRDMVLGYFIDMPKIFPSEFAHLITANRSDSHEDAETFKKDIEGNLALLKPGGVLLIDGIRSSYARDYRYEEIKELLEQPQYCEEYTAEAVLDSGPRPLAVLIQRKHPDKGYLSDESKCATFKDDVYFSLLDDIISRPDIAVLDQFRHKLLHEHGNEGNVDIFHKYRKIHQHAQGALDRHLYDEALRLLAAANSKPIHLILSALVTELGFSNKHKLLNLIKIIRTERRGAAGVRNKAGLSVRPSEATSKAPLFFNDCLIPPRDGQAPLSSQPHLQQSQFDILQAAILERIRGRDVSQRILSSASIEIICAKLMEEVGRLAQLKAYREMAFGDDAPKLKHRTLVGLPEIDGTGAQTYGSGNNCPTEAPAYSCPPEATSKADDLRQEIDRFKPVLIRLLEILKGKFSGPPILVIAPIGCITNDLLLRKLHGFLGDRYSDFVEVLSVDLSAPTPDPKFTNALSKGGIVFAGGSFEDPDSENGERFKELYIKPLCERLKDADFPLRFFSICFSTETVVNVLGEMMQGESDTRKLRAVPGALVCAADTPVHIRRKAVDHHPVLRHLCQREIPAAAMNGCHIIDLRSMSEIKEGSHTLTWLATGDLTNRRPVMGDIFDGRGFIMLPHPEVSSEEDLAEVLEVLHRFDIDALRTRYGRHFMKIIEHNYKGRPPDFGTPLIFFTLLRFVHELTNNNPSPFPGEVVSARRHRRRHHSSS